MVLKSLTVKSHSVIIESLTKDRAIIECFRESTVDKSGFCFSRGIEVNMSFARQVGRIEEPRAVQHLIKCKKKGGTGYSKLTHDNTSPFLMLPRPKLPSTFLKAMAYFPMLGARLSVTCPFSK